MCSISDCTFAVIRSAMPSPREIIATWLRTQMAARGWTPQQWARQAETTPTNITRALDPSQTAVMTFATQDALAKAAGVASALDFLAGAVKPGTAGSAPATPPPANDDETIDVKRVDMGYAMGPGTHIDDYPDEGSMRFGLSFLQSLTRAATDMLFVARGDGDSMFPTLINEDMVLIDTSQRVLNMQDRLWAVSVHGAGMIKRLRSIGKGRVRILSDNATVPPDEVDAEDLHIVGRVIWVGRRV